MILVYLFFFFSIVFDEDNAIYIMQVLVDFFLKTNI